MLWATFELAIVAILVVNLVNVPVATPRLVSIQELDSVRVLEAAPDGSSRYLAVLGDTQGRAAAVLTRECFHGKSLDVSVGFDNHETPDATGYHSKIRLIVTEGGISNVSGIDTDNATVSFSRTIHETILHTWWLVRNRTGFTLGDGSNGEPTSGGMGLACDLEEENNTLMITADTWKQDGTGWKTIRDYRKGSVLQSDAGGRCFRVGVQLDPNYNTMYNVTLSYLRVNVDRDGDGIDDALEELIRSELEIPDSDSDGINDGLDPRPTDPLVSSQLLLPVVCEPERSVSLTTTSAALLVTVAASETPAVCNITWPHTGHAEDAVVTVLDAFPPTNFTFASNGSASVAVPPGKPTTLRLMNADFAPIVDTTFNSLVHELGDSEMFNLSLSSLALDPETSTSDLIWSVGNSHNSSELSIDFFETEVGTFVSFTMSTSECREHDVDLLVTDAAGYTSTLSFRLHLVGSATSNLLSNGNFTSDGSAEGSFAWTGWSRYTWDGLYELTGLQQNGTTAAHLEGLTAGRAGIFQTVSLEEGTYLLSFDMAHLEGVTGAYGQTVDVTLGYSPTPQADTIYEVVRIDINSTESFWQHVQLNFSISSSSDVTIYLRFHGTGHVFFDSVALVQLLCHPPEQFPRLSVVTLVPPKPLNFAVPFRAETDGALCGYCNLSQPESLVCIRCASANYSGHGRITSIPSPYMIADFESGHPVPFVAGDWQYVDIPNSSRGARIQGSYISAYDTTGLLSDWSAYDFLFVDIVSNSSIAESFYVEIRDTQSTGYWSRVNWYTSVSPGTSTIAIPLQIFVGEKTVTRERRRLNLRRITRLVFATTLCDCVVYIDNVRLEAEPPYINSFTKLLRFDFGLPFSPVEYGFNAVTGASWYRNRLGYGIVPGSTIRRSEDRRHPTDLFRDWISISDGGFDVDLPRGNYVVWMMLEDAGYWEYYQSFQRRIVASEGITVLNETMSWEQFSLKYFAHEDSEDLPGDDAFTNYVRRRYIPLQFETEVLDGTLNLRFQSNDVYACTVSAVIIFPIEDRNRGEAFIDELWLKMKRRFDIEYVQAVYPPSGASQAPIGTNTRPFELFHRSLDDSVRGYDGQADDDVNLWENPLEVAVALNETAVSSFSIRAPLDVNLSIVELSSHLEGANFSATIVRSKFRRLSEGVYTAKPLLLDSVKYPVIVPSTSTKRFVVRFANLPSGCHCGSLHLRFGDGAILTIPIKVEVSPFQLTPIPSSIDIGYLGNAPIVPSTPFAQMRELQIRGFEASVQLLSEVGVTGLSGGLGGPKIVGYGEDGEIQMDFTNANLTMASLDQHWPVSTMVNSYFGLSLQGISTSSATWNYANIGEVFGRSYLTVLRDALAATEAVSQEEEWRDLYYSLGDEPSDETSIRVIEVAELFKQANPRAFTSVYTSIESNDSLKLAFADNIDLIIMNHHSVEAIEALQRRNPNVEFMLYNQAHRYFRGAYLYGVHILGGRGHYQFALSSPGADPYYALDAREDDLCSVFLRSDGSVTPTMDIEVTRNGLIDLRFLFTLAESIIHASNCGSTCEVHAQLAENLLNDLQSTMPIGTGSDYDHKYWNSQRLRIMRENISAVVNTMVSAGCGLTCEPQNTSGGCSQLPECRVDSMAGSVYTTTSQPTYVPSTSSTALPSASPSASPTFSIPTTTTSAATFATTTNVRVVTDASASSDALSAGMIGGIIASVVVAILLILLAAFMFRKQSRHPKMPSHVHKPQAVENPIYDGSDTEQEYPPHVE